MAQITKSPSKGPEQYVPFWRDSRVLGVFAQIGFIILVIIIFQTLGKNFASNVNRLGESQFICADGNFSYLCAYDFMSSEAGFDISDNVSNYVTTDSYWFAFYTGILNSLKVGLIGVVLTTFLGVFVGIARLSKNWLVSNIALSYIELFRNTPLLLQLFFIYFTILLALPAVKEATQTFGLPIFFTRRGMNVPSAEFTSSAAIWLAFLIMGIIQFQVVWIMLGRREERTGRSSNRWSWGILSLLVVVTIGWFVAGSVSDTQGILVPKSSRIREFRDLEKVILTRTGLNRLANIDTLTAEELDEASLQLCTLRDSSSETNFTRQLRQIGIPYQVQRFGRIDQVSAKYAEGSCEVIIASKAVLAAERSALESPDSHLIVSIKEQPIVWSIPTFEGLNIYGGSKLRPEFLALLIGLTLFYGASLAEIVRAGILSVGKGQSEAARALGLNEGQRLQLVILPQALKVIIPPLIGIYLSLMKDTSLGVAVGFPDMYTVSFTTINQSGRALQLMLLMMFVYLTISLIFSGLLNWYNARNILVER